MSAINEPSTVHLTCQKHELEQKIVELNKKGYYVKSGKPVEKTNEIAIVAIYTGTLANKLMK